MTSSSSMGVTQIILQFTLNRDIDAAAQDVQVAISRVLRQLPKDMPTPPTFRKVNPADQPILRIALTSPTLPLYTLNEYGDTLMAQRISMVSGVAQVQVFGAQKFAVRVQVDPQELAARGIGINQVAEAVAKANVNLPTGTLYGAQQALTVQASGQLTQAEPYNSVIVTYREGRPVRVGDIGAAYNSVENDKVAAWFVNQRSIILAVQRQPGTNTVEVAKGVKDLLPLMQAQLPASVSMHVLYDASTSIEESVQDVKFTLLFTLALVVLVIFIFLRRLPYTVIPSTAMPMSLVGTFIVMYLMGYNIDNLSLMALILAVGFVVDDAIVMLENIVRHLEMGEGPVKAALNGSREIGFTIVSMTLSLVAVFIPILFMGGILGRIFQEFAVTIGVAILISGLVSLTLTPMLCSRFLKAHDEQHPPGRFFNASERAYEAMLSLYRRSLGWFLDHRRITIGILVLVMGGTVVLLRLVPRGFIPSEDRAVVYGPTEAAEGISFEAMKRLQQALAEVVRQDPNVEAFMSNAGSRPGGIAGGNTGTLFLRLKPRHERELTADQVIQNLRPKLAQVPGIRAFLQNPPAISVGGRVTKSQYQYTLQGTDVEELYRLAPQVAVAVQALPGFIDVTTDLQLRNPQVNVDIHRDKAASLGVSVEQIEDALYSAYGSRQISTIFADTNQYQVILELKPEYQRDAAALSLLYVRSSSGALVPLDVLARISQGYGPLSINHSGQLPSVTISFNLRPGFALGDAVADHDHRELPGDGPGVRVVHSQPRAAARRRGAGHLHRAGHPLRELHPPAHDPLGAAARGAGRPLHPLRLQRAAGHLLVRGADPAGGPGEEERHHHGRLRPRTAAGRAQVAPRGHLRGVHRAVPADHDDDLRGPGGHDPDRGGLGGRRRVPPAPGAGGRGRALLLPDADPLHHPGVLPLHGRAAAPVPLPRPHGRGRPGRLTGRSAPEPDYPCGWGAALSRNSPASMPMRRRIFWSDTRSRPESRAAWEMLPPVSSSRR
jgi:HAE1 family hydrophobic/amphiphilic exporter-1